MTASRSVGFALLAAIVAAALLTAAPAGAQYSKSWDFLEAVEDGDRKEMRNLLNQGGNPNGRNGDGIPAMVLAGDKGDVSLMAYLLELGVNIDGVTTNRRESALMRRAEVGNTTVVRFLIENGANPDLRDKGGETALMKAVRSRKRGVIKLLIEAGADVNLSDFTGKTALSYAEEARSRGIIRLLVESGASE